MGKRNNTLKGNKQILKFKDVLKDSNLQNILEALAKKINKKQISNMFKISVTDIIRIKQMYVQQINEIRQRLIDESIESISSSGTTLQDITPKEVVKSIKDIVKTEPAVNLDNDVNIVEPIKDPKENTPEPPVEVNTVVFDKQQDYHRVKYNDDIISEIKRLLLEKVKVTEIVSRYNISRSTVYNIKAGIGRYKLINPSPNDTVIISGNMKQVRPVRSETNQVKSNIVNLDELHAIASSDDEKKLELNRLQDIVDNLTDNRVKVVKYLNVGMIDGRHNLPTDIFIFDSVPRYVLSNYDKLYDISYNRIFNLMKENPDMSGINLYITGLAPVLGAIIKACFNLQINLILYHYNPTSDKYIPQELFSTFTSNNVINSNYFENLKYDELYTYGCNTGEFITIDSSLRYRTAYEVIEFLYDGGNDKGRKSIVLFNTYNDAKYYFETMRKYHQIMGTRVKLILNDINLNKDDESITVSQTLFEYMNK